ncbi:MAG TPA: MCP four helix bundle domain-containing protein [Gammaproteobacteria bacterium]|nr:MCP four helix bundle domain-containing protein [Gammaproteobacteria bacterium]
MKSLKVGVKLGLGFGVVLLLLVAVAAVGISRLAMIDVALNDIVRDKWPKIGLLQEGLSGVHEVAVAARDIVLVRDRAMVQQSRERIIAGRNAIGKAWEQLAQRLVEPKSKELLRAIMDTRARYIAVQNRIIELA